MNFQIQPLKSQIVNMKFKIDNIELQMMNNYHYPITNLMSFNTSFMNNGLIGEQLLKLSMQMINAGIQAFNIGKEFDTYYMQNYLCQLKQISDQINIIIINENNILQQKIMKGQMMIQNFMKERQMDELNKVKAINFYNKSLPESELFQTIYAKYGEKVEEVLNQYLNRISCYVSSKNEAIFQYKGNNIDRNEQRVIEDYFSSSTLNEPIIVNVSYNK